MSNKAQPAIVSESVSETGARTTTIRQGDHYVVVMLSGGAPVSLVDAAARLMRQQGDV